MLEPSIPAVLRERANLRPDEKAFTFVNYEQDWVGVQEILTWSQLYRRTLRVHDLRHTYASLSRRAGADLRLLQKAIGHASITVTAHTYADLFDDELDNIAAALDSLSDDLSQST